MPKPVLQAFLLADHVYRDEATKKALVAGIFNQISPEKFPAVHALCWAFLSFTDVKGKVTVDLQLRNLSTNEVVVTMGGVVLSSTDPNRTVEFSLAIRNLPLPAPGPFSIDVVWEEEILGSLRLAIVERGKEPQ